MVAKGETVDVRATGREELGPAFDRIEAAVGAGSTDLKALGFWPLVSRVKLDRALTFEFADQIGRIDTAAFRARVRARVPVWVGNTVLLLGIIVGGLAVGAAFAWQTPLWEGLALVAAGGIWSLTVHSPTHWVVGRVVGIEWTDYFLGGPPPPRPGLKSDYATYLRAEPDARAWMHASGALATKAAPFVALAFWPASGAPGWSAAVLVGIGLLEVLTDITISTRSSDWKKFRRERAVAKRRRAALEPGAPQSELDAVTGPPVAPRESPTDP
jgi:hypothetical protein